MTLDEWHDFVFGLVLVAIGVAACVLFLLTSCAP